MQMRWQATKLANPGIQKDGRLSSARRGYGHRWRNARLRYLQRFPLCRDCKERGIVRAAEHVHHEMKAKLNPELFWDESYWMPLCEPCHNARTASGE